MIRKLQLIQNSAARLVVGRRMRDHDHITPVLWKLHWLPVSLRINFKILCVIFKVIHHRDTAPRYLKEILSVHIPTRSTRSSSEIRLSPYPSKIPTKKSYADRDIAVNGTSLWNNLPADLRNVPTYDRFKSSLKTYLFRTHYDN